jgi:hypothetical protein
MSTRGADFADILPLNGQGVLDTAFRPLPYGSNLDTQAIAQFTPNNSFRLGQQVYFWLGLASQVVETPGLEDNYVMSARLKPWWARPAREFRQPGGGNGSLGAQGWLPIDTQVFRRTTLFDNRWVWTPSPKRLDVTPYDTAPPPTPPPMHSDSLLLDDCWTADLYDPTDPAIQAKFPAPQFVARWLPILYPAFGYALGFTAEVEVVRPPEQNEPAPALLVSLQWSVGTFGGGARICESIG